MTHSGFEHDIPLHKIIIVNLTMTAFFNKKLYLPGIIDCESNAYTLTFIDTNLDHSNNHRIDYLIYNQIWKRKIQNGINVTIFPSKYCEKELVKDGYVYTNHQLLKSLHQYLNKDEQIIDINPNKQFKITSLKALRSNSTFIEYINHLKNNDKYNVLTILIDLNYNVSNYKLSLDCNDSNNKMLSAIFISKDNNNNITIKTCVFLPRYLWMITNKGNGDKSGLKIACQCFTQCLIHLLCKKIVPFIFKENAKCNIKLMPLSIKARHLLYFWDRFHQNRSLKIRNHFVIKLKLWPIMDMGYNDFLETEEFVDITVEEQFSLIGITSFDGLFSNNDTKLIINDIAKYLKDTNLSVKPPHFSLIKNASLSKIESKSFATSFTDNLIELHTKNRGEYKIEKEKLAKYERALNGLNAFLLKSFSDHDNNINININFSINPPLWFTNLIYSRFKQLNMEYLLNKYHFSFVYQSPSNCNSFNIPIHHDGNLNFQNSECLLMVFCEKDVVLYSGEIALNILSGRIYYFSYDSLTNDYITIINNQHKCCIVMLRNNVFIDCNDNNSIWYDINQFKDEMNEEEIQINVGINYQDNSKIDNKINQQELSIKYEQIIDEYHLRLDFESELWAKYREQRRRAIRAAEERYFETYGYYPEPDEYGEYGQYEFYEFYEEYPQFTEVEEYNDYIEHNEYDEQEYEQQITDVDKDMMDNNVKDENKVIATPQKLESRTKSMTRPKKKKKKKMDKDSEEYIPLQYHKPDKTVISKLMEANIGTKSECIAASKMVPDPHDANAVAVKMMELKQQTSVDHHNDVTMIKIEENTTKTKSKTRSKKKKKKKSMELDKKVMQQIKDFGIGNENECIAASKLVSNPHDINAVAMKMMELQITKQQETKLHKRTKSKTRPKKQKVKNKKNPKESVVQKLTELNIGTESECIDASKMISNPKDANAVAAKVMELRASKQQYLDLQQESCNETNSKTRSKTKEKKCIIKKEEDTDTDTKFAELCADLMPEESDLKFTLCHKLPSFKQIKQEKEQKQQDRHKRSETLNQTQLLHCKEFILSNQLSSSKPAEKEIDDKFNNILVNMTSNKDQIFYLKQLYQETKTISSKWFKKDILWHIANGYEVDEKYDDAIKYYTYSLKIFASTETLQRIYICKDNGKKWKKMEQENWISLLIEACNDCLSNDIKHKNKREEWLKWGLSEQVETELVGGAKCALIIARYFQDKYKRQFNDYTLIWYKSALNILEMAKLICIEKVPFCSVIDSFQQQRIKKERYIDIIRHQTSKIHRKRVYEKIKRIEYKLIDGVLFEYQECIIERFRNCGNYKDACNELRGKRIDEFECFYEWHQDKDRYNHNFNIYLRRELDCIFEMNHWSSFWKKTYDVQLSDAYINYGSFAMDVINDAEFGLIWLSTAKQFSNNDAILMWNIGEAQQKSGRYQQAIKSYCKSILCTQDIDEKQENLKRIKPRIDEIIKAYRNRKYIK